MRHIIGESLLAAGHRVYRLTRPHYKLSLRPVIATLHHITVFAMDLQSLLEPLIALPKAGSGPGLRRLASLCDSILTSPWFRDTSVIHVVGTDGKGSVAAMLAALLKGLGVRCGCYTSPHLFHFRERIVVDGEAIRNSDLMEAIQWVQSQINHYQQQYPEDILGAFEVFTALALYHFAQTQPRVLVIEAGIGGRWDCTRVLGGDLALLTSVDLEHTALLGNTREAIAADKMDILEPGGQLILGALGDELEAFVYRRGVDRGLKVYTARDQVQWRELHQGRNGMILQGMLNDSPIENLHCSLTGPHQADNLALALAGLTHWMTQHCLYLHAAQIPQVAHQVLPRIHWPGRFQRIRSNPSVYVDVGHTHQAMEMLAATIQQTALPAPILLLGVSQGREPQTLLAPLLAEAHGVVLTQSHHRGMPVAELAAALNHPSALLEADPAQALQRALDLAQRDNRPVLVAGGLFLAVEISAILQGEDPQELLLF